jgi:hypothetical protein
MFRILPTLAWQLHLLLALYLGLMQPQPVMAEARSHGVSSKSPAPFVLTTEGNCVSLTATNASLKAILEEIGRQLHIEVVATIPPEETITSAFFFLY